MNTQYLRSLQALHFIRSVEKAFGVDSIRSLDLSKRGPLIRPFSAHGTPAKRHKITDRGARKAKLRAYANARVAEYGLRV